MKTFNRVCVVLFGVGATTMLIVAPVVGILWGKIALAWSMGIGAVLAYSGIMAGLTVMAWRDAGE